ncbi:MAG: PIN domain-containing protein [Novosphingobium sp.]
MTMHSVKITSDGRIQIPAQLRREMNLRAGETLNLELHDGTLSVRRPSKTLERIRARLAPYLAPDALAAFVLGEPHDVDENELLADACMSAVNLAEFRAVLAKNGVAKETIAETVRDFGFKILPFGEAEADVVGNLIAPARKLNIGLGDCACIATGQIEGLTIWTADRDWLKLEAPGADIRLIRNQP